MKAQLGDESIFKCIVQGILRPFKKGLVISIIIDCLSLVLRPNSSRSDCSDKWTQLCDENSWVFSQLPEFARTRVMATTSSSAMMILGARMFVHVVKIVIHVRRWMRTAAVTTWIYSKCLHKLIITRAYRLQQKEFLFDRSSMSLTYFTGLFDLLLELFRLSMLVWEIALSW